MDYLPASRDPAIPAASTGYAAGKHAAVRAFACAARRPAAASSRRSRQQARTPRKQATIHAHAGSTACQCAERWSNTEDRQVVRPSRQSESILVRTPVQSSARAAGAITRHAHRVANRLHPDSANTTSSNHGATGRAGYGYGTWMCSARRQCRRDAPRRGRRQPRGPEPRDRRRPLFAHRWLVNSRERLFHPAQGSVTLCPFNSLRG